MNSKTLSNQEISSFCEQFSLILRSGIPASEGLSLMAEDAGTEGRHILRSMQDILEQTGSLYQAMNDAGVFPSYALHMAEIGERSGTCLLYTSRCV